MPLELWEHQFLAFCYGSLSWQIQSHLPFMCIFYISIWEMEHGPLWSSYLLGRLMASVAIVRTAAPCTRTHGWLGVLWGRWVGGNRIYSPRGASRMVSLKSGFEPTPRNCAQDSAGCPWKKMLISYSPWADPGVSLSLPSPPNFSL